MENQIKEIRESIRESREREKRTNEHIDSIQNELRDNFSKLDSKLDEAVGRAQEQQQATALLNSGMDELRTAVELESQENKLWGLEHDNQITELKRERGGTAEKCCPSKI